MLGTPVELVRTVSQRVGTRTIDGLLSDSIGGRPDVTLRSSCLAAAGAPSRCMTSSSAKTSPITAARYGRDDDEFSARKRRSPGTVPAFVIQVSTRCARRGALAGGFRHERPPESSVQSFPGGPGQ